MEPIYGPDRSLLIEAFLMDELKTRMRRVRALRRLERRHGALSVELIDLYLTTRLEEEDIAVSLWHWSGRMERLLPIQRAHRALIVSALLLRFAAGLGNKVRWPGILKQYFSDIHLMGLVPRLEGDAVSRWYRGLTIHSQMLRSADWGEWLLGSSFDIVMAYEDEVRAEPDTDRPPP